MTVLTLTLTYRKPMTLTLTSGNLLMVTNNYFDFHFFHFFKKLKPQQKTYT